MSAEAFEDTGGLGVLNHYGVRTVEGKFGGKTCEAVVKHIVYDITYEDLSSTSAAAVNGLEYVIPAGSSLLSCRYVVETAIVGPTAITCGTYKASDGTTAIDADGLMTAAAGVVTALDADRDVLVGTGAQLTTGTGGVGALEFDAVIRILPTVAAATAGKMRVYISYLAPAP